MSMSMLGVLGVVLLVIIVLGVAGVMLSLRLLGARAVKDDHPN